MKSSSPHEIDLFANIEKLAQSLKKETAFSTEILLLKSLLEDMAEGVVIAGSAGEYLFLNSAADKIFGQPGASLVKPENWPETYGIYRMDGTTLFRFEDLPLTRAIRGEKTDGIEMFLRSERFPQGTFLLVRGRPLRDPQGNVTGGIVFCEDITQFKEEQVRAQRMTDLIAVSPIGIIQTTTDAKVVSWNGYAERIYGYSAEEIVGKSYNILVPVYKIPLMQEQIKKLLSGEPVKSHETVRIRKDGKAIVTWCSASPLLDTQGQVRGFALATRDITDRVLPPVAEQVLDAIMVVSNEGRITAWNPSAEKIFDYSREEAVGKSFLDFFPRTLQASAEHLLLSAHEGQTLSDFHTQTQKKGGDIIEISLSVSPCKNEEGKVFGLSVVIRDITELKMAESRISQWKSIVDASTEGVSRDDLDGKITYWNKGCERIYGYSREEMLGKPFSVLVPEGQPDDFNKVLDHIKKGHAIQYEAVRRRKDGQTIHISATLSPLKDSDGKVLGSSVFIKDITERERLKVSLKHQEEQLLQAQKMEVVGRMASGIAHDFNNLLTSISGYVQILGRVALEEEGRELVDNISDMVNRAADLTKQLLMFGRKQPAAAKELDLNHAVSEEVRLLQRMISSKVLLQTELGEEVPSFQADPTEVRQVLMNLVLNAQDAMPSGGTVLFCTQPWLSKGKGPDGSSMPAGLFAWLSVKDSGTGMDEETKKHIFDPFFTTKGEGKGTGLGLAIVYSILTKRGGKIWVESEPGKGTTFHLCFAASVGS